jgi:4-phosphopantoate---beta-alanine ligase
LATRGGIFDADVVLIPLEDGDRCEALVKMEKKVVAIDLNPLSRTSRMATVTIVDNIARAVPNLVFSAAELSKTGPEDWRSLLREYDNNVILRQTADEILNHLNSQFSQQFSNTQNIFMQREH